jgi:hypothetical protein
MKPSATFISILFLTLALFAAEGMAQNEADIKKRVDELVGKHYMDGVPYEAAHQLGPSAVPYLFELLGNPEQKEFWVNIIVTIGFIEEPSGVNRLVAFLENARGEVDSFEARALFSVPYALGCIASGGDSASLQYLVGKLEAPQNKSAPWSFRKLPVNKVIAEQSVMALAISGRPEARHYLKKMSGTKARAMRDQIDQALVIMDRIAKEGRAAVLNPHYSKHRK